MNSRNFIRPLTPAPSTLNGLSLTLNDGDFVTVIGGNGAGKSTMLNATAGTFFVDSGKVIIDGIEQPHTMSELLRSCKPTTEFPSTLISFGQDGSAIRGTLCEALTSTQPGQPSPVEPSYQNKNPVATVTTHNFPSGVTPFPGAE